MRNVKKWDNNLTGSSFVFLYFVTADLQMPLRHSF